MSDDTIWIEDSRKAKPKVDPDLAYLAEKTGLDASKLKEERLAKEKAEIAALNAEVLDHYAERYLVTIGDKRVSKAKNFEAFKCDHCRKTLRGAEGVLRGAVDIYRNKDLRRVAQYFPVKCNSCMENNSVLVQVTI